MPALIVMGIPQGGTHFCRNMNTWGTQAIFTWHQLRTITSQVVELDKVTEFDSHKHQWVPHIPRYLEPSCWRDPSAQRCMGLTTLDATAVARYAMCLTTLILPLSSHTTWDETVTKVLSRSLETDELRSWIWPCTYRMYGPRPFNWMTPIVRQSLQESSEDGCNSED